MSCSTVRSPQLARSTLPSRSSTISLFGVDLVEVMPVAAFDGTQGWGTTSALCCAERAYGGRRIQRFVDRHARGLGVVLDVV